MMSDAATPRGPAAPGLIGRLRRLSAADAALLAEAFVMLALSSAAIRLASFARVGRMASWPRRLGETGRHDELAARIAWAVGACARRAPWRAVCFQQGLAAQIMLRRRGVDSTLYFGAAREPTTGLSAHVWVKDRGADIIGCEEASRFAVLATFPPGGTTIDSQAARGRKRFDALDR